MQKLATDIVSLSGAMEDHGAYLRRYCPMKDAA